MKKFFLLLVMALGAIGMQAQYAWMENAPEKYLPAMTDKVISRASACNQGEEAFMDFIPKFRTDAKLRGERIKLDPEDEMGKLTLDNFENWNIIKAGKGVNKREGLKYYGTWFNVSENMVCFRYSDEPTDPNAEWGGSGALFCFQRIEGKWYLTSVMMAG